MLFPYGCRCSPNAQWRASQHMPAGGASVTFDFAAPGLRPLCHHGGSVRLPLNKYPIHAGHCLEGPHIVTLVECWQVIRRRPGWDLLR
jgi:hypothetical protein